MKVYEDNHIVIYEYNNGTMMIDKTTGMMISWEGKSEGYGMSELYDKLAQEYYHYSSEKRKLIQARMCLLP